MRSEQQIQAEIEQCVFQIGVIMTNARVARKPINERMDALGEELKEVREATARRAAEESPARMAERIAALEVAMKNAAEEAERALCPKKE